MGIEYMSGSREHENEPSVSIQFGEFPYQVTTFHLLMQGSAALSPPIKCGFHSAKSYERNKYLRTYKTIFANKCTVY